ncbi:MAG: hypothetical protein F9K13_02760 [Candidatus Methylomirabilis oxygeniifera]|uniref:Uncharacterized protein n=1 Tax=Methylomirabilis oxygeniifera TaxID=671143 RepID=D5MF85_METO1|nr:MAG: hypothetical protein F9K13_02760 [Candidatus Methylomirabilis oxyfera]CBE68414.1 protein of unknown function [Candidatus Methylomirabilis oxyfera]
MTDDLLRQIWEAVKRFSWLAVVKRVSGLAFRGKAWRCPAIYYGRTIAWFDLLTTGNRSGRERGERFAYARNDAVDGWSRAMEVNAHARVPQASEALLRPCAIGLPMLRFEPIAAELSGYAALTRPTPDFGIRRKGRGNARDPIDLFKGSHGAGLRL